MIGCQYDVKILLDDEQRLFVRGRTCKKIYEETFLSLRSILSQFHFFKILPLNNCKQLTTVISF